MFDIETLGLAANDPILCISWKIFKEKKINFIAAWDFKTWENLNKAKNPKDISRAFQNLDRELVKKIHKEFSDADCLIGHYENRFDLPFLKTRMLKHNVGFLPKTIQTDTWRIARDNLKLLSNRLGAINEFFNLKKKLKQNDLSLWTAVKMDNKHAKKLMKEYNIRDVEATESTVKKLIGYAKIPAKKLIDDRPTHICKCGSTKIWRHSIRNTLSTSYQRYKCDACGSYYKGMVLKRELRHEN